MFILAKGLNFIQFGLKRTLITFYVESRTASRT
jgi:hypothetical protein